MPCGPGGGESESQHEHDPPVLDDVAEPEATHRLWLVRHGMELLSLRGLDLAKSWQPYAAPVAIIRDCLFINRRRLQMAFG